VFIAESPVSRSDLQASKIVEFKDGTPKRRHRSDGTWSKHEGHLFQGFTLFVQTVEGLDPRHRPGPHGPARRVRGSDWSQSSRPRRCCRSEPAPSHALKHLPRFDVRPDKLMKAAAVLLLISVWQAQLVSAQTSTCSVSITGTPAGAVQAASIACSGPTVQMTGAMALQTFSAKFSQGTLPQARRA